MSEKNNESPAPIAEIEHGPSKFEQFLDAHQKKLIILGILLIIGIGTYVVMDEMKKSHHAEAAAAYSNALQEDLPALRQVLEKYPNTPTAGALTITIAQRQWNDAQQSEAILTLQDFINQHDDHPHLGTALNTLASYQHELGNLDEAKANYLRVTEREDSRFLAPHALTSLGDIALRSGDKEQARSYYEQASADEFKGIAPTNLTQMRLKALDVDPPEAIDPPKLEDSALTPTELPGTAPTILPGAPPAPFPNMPPAAPSTAPPAAPPTAPTPTTEIEAEAEVPDSAPNAAPEEAAPPASEQK